jgi:hypothetical protein
MVSLRRNDYRRSDDITKRPCILMGHSMSSSDDHWNPDPGPQVYRAQSFRGSRKYALHRSDTPSPSQDLSEENIYDSSDSDAIFCETRNCVSRSPGMSAICFQKR